MFLARAIFHLGVNFQPKIGVGFYRTPPNHPFVLIGFGTNIFTIHFGGFPLIFGNTNFCSSQFFVTEVFFLELAGCREMMEFPWGANPKNISTGFTATLGRRKNRRNLGPGTWCIWKFATDFFHLRWVHLLGPPWHRCGWGRRFGGLQVCLGS